MNEIPFKKSGILTPMSVTDITRMLASYYDIRKNLVVPNVSWGFMWYEADLVVITKAGYMTEIEIKRSWTDFLADFKKRDYHSDARISRFYYAVPECMLQPCRDYIENWLAERCLLSPSTYKRPGFIVYRTWDEPLYRRVQVICDPISKEKTPPLSEKDILKIARLGTLRYWSLLNRTSETEKDRKIGELKSLITEIKADYKAATGESWKLEDYC